MKYELLFINKNNLNYILVVFFNFFQRIDHIIE